MQNSSASWCLPNLSHTPTCTHTPNRYIYALVTSSEIIGGPVWFIFLLLVFDVCYGITAACCCAAGRRRRRGAAVAAGPADGASAADSRGAGGGGAGGGADTCVDIRPGYALPKFELSASAGPATAAYSTRSTRAAPTSALAEAEPYSVGRALAGMAAAAAVLYSLCFAIRIPCPPGYWTPFVQINIGYLPQYIFCYIFGIWAQRSGALARLPACLWPWCLAVGGLWAAGGWVANLWVAEFDWGVVMSASGSLGYNAFFSVYEQVFAVREVWVARRVTRRATHGCGWVAWQRPGLRRRWVAARQVRPTHAALPERGYCPVGGLHHGRLDNIPIIPRRWCGQWGCWSSPARCAEPGLGARLALGTKACLAA